MFYFYNFLQVSSSSVLCCFESYLKLAAGIKVQMRRFLNYSWKLKTNSDKFIELIKCAEIRSQRGSTSEQVTVYTNGRGAGGPGSCLTRGLIPSFSPHFPVCRHCLLSKKGQNRVQRMLLFQALSLWSNQQNQYLDSNLWAKLERTINLLWKL